MTARMHAAPLAEELNRLTAEVARLERRIADGEGGIADHILLQATLRTQVNVRAALAASGVGWAVALRANTAVNVGEEAARPRNVAQLFTTSTHRAVLGVF
jgi:hypothetical protein